MSWSILIPGFVLVAGAAAVAVGVVRAVLLRHAVMDHPNERSSHSVPTPRGGGIGVLAVALPAWVAIGLTIPSSLSGPAIAGWAVAAGASGLALISWIDDLRGLGAAVRLAGQFVATAALVLFLPGAVFQGLLPPYLDAAAAALLWVWFVNLYNFMDGIDGITAVETIAIGLGLALVGLTAVPLVADHLQAGILAAAALGFLVWNRPPAKIFLGDVGSVPLGYLLGWLLLGLAATGQWQAALILPLYYLADATLTLGRRARRGETIWRAHREHFYQRATQTGRSHGTVAGAIGGVNLLLVGLALAAAHAGPGGPHGWLSLGAAVLLVAALLFWMARSPAHPPDSGPR
jgi:UDP-N-acetylmuramyl pentapeptide phosphotransferase/UDP-N-acetylglucosamine-1-phosphate transferase